MIDLVLLSLLVTNPTPIVEAERKLSTRIQMSASCICQAGNKTALFELLTPTTLEKAKEDCQAYEGQVYLSESFTGASVFTIIGSCSTQIRTN